MDVLGWIGELGGVQPEGGGVLGFGGACASEGEGSDVGTLLPISHRMNEVFIALVSGRNGQEEQEEGVRVVKCLSEEEEEEKEEKEPSKGIQPSSLALTLLNPLLTRTPPSPSSQHRQKQGQQNSVASNPPASRPPPIAAPSDIFCCGGAWT